MTMLALASKYHYSVQKGLILTFDLPTAPKIKNRVPHVCRLHKKNLNSLNFNKSYSISYSTCNSNDVKIEYGKVISVTVCVWNSLSCVEGKLLFNLSDYNALQQALFIDEEVSIAIDMHFDQRKETT